MTDTHDPTAITTDPARFSDWWQKRSATPRADLDIVKAAAAAGLITSSSGMLALTGKGAAMRSQHLDSTPESGT